MMTLIKRRHIHDFTSYFHARRFTTYMDNDKFTLISLYDSEFTNNYIVHHIYADCYVIKILSFNANFTVLFINRIFI